MVSTSYHETHTSIDEKAIQPLGWIVSMALFGIPTLLLIWSVWWMRPFMMNVGMSSPAAYTLSLGLINTLLVGAALAAYAREGRPLTWTAFASRMRLTSLSGKVWLWTIGSTLFFGVLALIIEPLAGKVYASVDFELPIFLTGGLNLPLKVITLALNILGEELWWRGYILPRQELGWGKITWLIHGTMWACFHLFKWYAVPFMLITCQVIPFVAQRTKNTWPGILNHLIINGAGMILQGL